MRAWLLGLVLPLALAGCGDLPRPFQGNPGRVGAHLALPPPPLLAVGRPHDALLPAAADRPFASAVAAALSERTVPAVARVPARGDWRLVIGARRAGGEVTPRYTVIDPTLKRQGSVSGKPVSAAAWTEGAPNVLKTAAAEDAGAIAALLTGIDARLKRSNPESLLNRQARVYFAGVSGAPTDGDGLLAGAMRRDLLGAGVHLQDHEQNADFTVNGKVSVRPASGAQERVEVQWVVTDARGRERGRVVQLNQVAARTIEPSWADVAPTIAEQAAGGVRTVLEKARMAP